MCPRRMNRRGFQAGQVGALLDPELAAFQEHFEEWSPLDELARRGVLQM